MEKGGNKKIKKQLKSRKSLSRLMAVQIFYQHNFFNNNADLEKIKNDLIENYALEEHEEISSYRAEIDEDLLSTLVSGLSLYVKKIDDEIKTFLSEKQSLEKIDDLTLQILRLAAFELKFMEQVPTNVVIDEYVGIAASFFDNQKVTFVNALIDAMAKKLRDLVILDAQHRGSH